MDHDDGDNDSVYSSASNDSDNGEISNVIAVDAPEPEDKEEMEEHVKLLEDPVELPKKIKVQKFGRRFE